MKKYKNFKIEPNPTEKFPEMVIITKGKNLTKQFISEDKAIIWIESSAALQLINRGSKNVTKELDSISLGYEQSLITYDTN